jgi:hypothetical protein
LPLLFSFSLDENHVMKTQTLLAALLAMTAACPALAVDAVEPAASPFNGHFGAYVGASSGGWRGGSGHFSASVTSLPNRYTQSWAAASLADGKLHASATATRMSCGPRGCHTKTGATATAIYWDTISFVNGQNIGLADIELSIDGVMSPLGSQASVRWYVGHKPSDFWSDVGRYAETHVLSNGTTVIDDGLALPLGNSTFFVYAELTVSALAVGNWEGGAWDAVADFGNTLHFNWTLPEGVTYSSASGQFMTAVPEPASAVLMLGGLLGFAVRRSRHAQR